MPNETDDGLKLSHTISTTRKGTERSCSLAAPSNEDNVGVVALGSAGTRQSSTASSAYRSPLSRDDSGGYRSQRTSRDESVDTPTSAGSRYGSSTTTTPSSYTSRFLNKSKSSANVDEDESSRAKTAAVPDESTRYRKCGTP